MCIATIIGIHVKINTANDGPFLHLTVHCLHLNGNGLFLDTGLYLEKLFHMSGSSSLSK